MKLTPPLQEKRRFGASGPLRFKKNDVFRQETFVKWVFLHIYCSGYGCSIFLLKNSRKVFFGLLNIAQDY